MLKVTREKSLIGHWMTRECILMDTIEGWTDRDEKDVEDWTGWR